MFCGSNRGVDPRHAAAAAALGTLVARRGIRLVFGGGRVGLMGVVADAALAAGGKVEGVIPRALANREVAHQGLTELHLVDSMHERKARMASLADGFLALPGGLGTLEELAEILTWAQLGIHRKPCAILDVAGFWGPLVAFLDHGVDEGFIRKEHRAMLLVGDDAAQVIDAMEQFQPADVRKWIDDAAS